MVSDYLFFEGTIAPHKKRSAPVRPAPRRVDVSAETESSEFFEKLFGKAGLCARSYRQSALQRRVGACLRYAGVRDLDSAWKKLERHPDLLHGMVNVVLLGVTEFFRDRPVFEQVREVVMQDWNGGTRPLRIWSAACSDGHELYSMGMLLSETGRLANAELLGTDFRPEAIERARQGRYAIEALHALDADWRERYFCHAGSQPRIHDQLRKATQWKQADLLTAVEPGPWDMILWRNMAIYLEPRANERVWRALIRELSRGAYLITGKADHPPPGHGLERVAPCIYRKPFVL